MIRIMLRRLGANASHESKIRGPALSRYPELLAVVDRDMDRHCLARQRQPVTDWRQRYGKVQYQV